jgi:hypothetical protein
VPVSSTWTNPSAAGTLDLSTGSVLTEGWTDAVASNFLYLGGVAGVVTQSASTGYSGAISTTSASLVSTGDLASLTTQASGIVLAFYTGSCVGASANQTASFGISVDGAAPAAIGCAITTTGTGFMMQVSMVTRISGLSAASHSFTAFWGISGGITLSQGNGSRVMTVLELRR